MQNKNKLADHFINQYPVPKTLRFALKPIGETSSFLGLDIEEKSKFSEVIQEDKDIKESYPKIKELLDELHVEFIREALYSYKNKLDYNVLNQIHSKYKDYLKLKKQDNQSEDGVKKESKKDIENIRAELDKLKKEFKNNISKHFNDFSSQTYKIQKTKNKNTKDEEDYEENDDEEENKNNKKSKSNKDFCLSNITKKDVFDILKQKYKEPENIKTIEKFCNFLSYLNSYNTNRKNYYGIEKGSIAERIVDDIMITFFDNIKKYEEKYKNKDLLGSDNLNIFDINYFSNLLLQEGIDEYNGIIAGKKGQENKGENANRGFNSKINRYKQEASQNMDFNKRDYPFFKETHKQIGSSKESFITSLMDIKSDKDLIKSLENFINSQDNKDLLNQIKSFHKSHDNFAEKDDESLKGIYLKKSEAIKWSNVIFGNWSIVADVYKSKKEKKQKDGSILYEYEFLKSEKGEDKRIKEKDFVSLYDIKQYFIEKEKAETLHADNIKLQYREMFNIKDDDKVFDKFVKIIQEENRYLFDGFCSSKPDLQDLKKCSLKALEDNYLQAIKQYEEKINNNEEISKEEEQEYKKDIKDYLDRVLEITSSVKIFDISTDGFNINEDFYDELNNIKSQESFENIYKSYNEFRNYITKANIEIDKFKLNFSNGTLMFGWDLNKETDNTCVIFRERDRYYLGIINYSNKYILDKTKNPDIFSHHNSDFQKMEYKYFPSPSKMIPKISFSNAAKVGKENIGWTIHIQSIKDEFALFQDSKRDNKDKWQESFDIKKIHELIDYYKQVLSRHSENYVKTFDLTFKDTEDYKNIGEFNKDVARQSYKIKFVDISKDYIYQKVKTGELYLFQIYNKDFSKNKKSNSKDNLHTTYFKELFSDDNLKNPIFKLSGEGEIFFRDRISKYKERDQKNKDGNTVVNHNDEVVKEHQRYTKKQISLHIPIVLNNVVDSEKDMSKTNNFNKSINEYIKNNSESLNILGIDRGEKNLLYYTITDIRGNIIKSPESINTIIESNGTNTDYQQKLSHIGERRDQQRKSWNQIENIKNTKLGYLSRVVNIIVTKAIEYNAIIIMEDLNFGFKTGRQHIEKSIYQQFEKALINKLSFVVDKDKANHRSAPQLSAPFESFEKIGKQTGIIYYVPAKNTSKMCPNCNWQKDFLNMSYTSRDNFRKSLEDAKLTCNYIEDKDIFEFSYVVDKKTININSNVNRLYYDQKENKIKEFSKDINKNYQSGKVDGADQQGSLTYNFKKLFFNYEQLDKTGFTFSKDKDIIQQILDILKQKDISNNYVKGYKTFSWLFNIMLNTRNSNQVTNVDYIECPSCNYSTNLKDSDFKYKNKNAQYIKDADANGAYNIARKGSMIIDIIKNSDSPKLAFKDKDYREFLEKLINTNNN